MRVVLLLLMLASLLAGPAFAQSIDFGDDSGEWALDGECDDARFEGPAMTLTPLLAEDVMRDATDCRTAFERGHLVLRGVDEDGDIDFGDDTGEWANDGECDDMRFEGPGLTQTPLLYADIMRDASDCSAAFKSGRLQLVGQ